MKKQSSGELLHGTLARIVLRILNVGSNHGFAIGRRIELISQNVIRAEKGSLYPALHGMELEGWLVSEWGVTGNGRKAKYCTLTPSGRKQLKQETARWNAITYAMSTILREA